MGKKKNSAPSSSIPAQVVRGACSAKNSTKAAHSLVSESAVSEPRMGKKTTAGPGLVEGVSKDRVLCFDDIPDSVGAAPVTVVAGKLVSEHFPTLSDAVNRGALKNALAPGSPSAVADVSEAAGATSGAGLYGKLAYRPPSSDRCLIRVSDGLSVLSVWGWSLLGQYVGSQPGHFQISDVMRSWRVKASYDVEEGWMIFQFASEEDRDKVLRGSPYFICGEPLLLKYIPDKFAYNCLDIATIPVWVRLFGLSKIFWTPDILGRVASHIGKPLFMDPVTESRKRGAYARVLIEVDFAEPIVREVMINFDNGDSVTCTFLVENEHLYWKGCCPIGHRDEACSFKEKMTAARVKSKKASKVVSKSAVTGKDKPAGGMASKDSAEDSPVSKPSQEAPVVPRHDALAAGAKSADDERSSPCDE